MISPGTVSSTSAARMTGRVSSLLRGDGPFAGGIGNADEILCRVLDVGEVHEGRRSRHSDVRTQRQLQHDVQRDGLAGLRPHTLTHERREVDEGKRDLELAGANSIEDKTAGSIRFRHEARRPNPARGSSTVTPERCSASRAPGVCPVNSGLSRGAGSERMWSASNHGRHGHGERHQDSPQRCARYTLIRTSAERQAASTADRPGRHLSEGRNRIRADRRRNRRSCCA